MTLELIPNGDLVFKGPFNAVSTTTLKLQNSGAERLAYKIKTTAPKRYCVKPNSGFLDSRGTAGIQVMLQPQAAGQPDDRSKHKFMVQWVAVPATYTEDVDSFWKKDLKTLNVQDSKLKCIFADEQMPGGVPSDSHGHRESDAPSSRTIGSTNVSEPQSTKIEEKSAFSSSSIPNQQSTPVQARTSTQPSASNPVRPQNIMGDDSNKSYTKPDLDRLNDENENMRKLKEQENTCRQRATSGDRSAHPVIDRPKSNSQQQTGLVVFGITVNEQIVLIAFVVAILFGFSLGYFLFSCGN